MLAEIRSGMTTLADGTTAPARASRNGSLINGDGQGCYYEQASKGSVFSLVLNSWTTAISAGNLVGAAANASTQFAVWNPTGSGKNLSLLKFGVALISGTTPAGALFHSYSNTAPTIATAVVSPICCNNVGMAAASVARALTHVSGSALTGSSILAMIRMADLSFSAGTYANLATQRAIEYINGDIVIPPGTCWVPTWSLAGTTVLGSYSITWEEIPI
jgi:hypothetical protein